MKALNDYIVVKDTINDSMGVSIEDDYELGISRDSLVIWNPTATFIKQSIDGTEYTFVKKESVVGVFEVEE